MIRNCMLLVKACSFFGKSIFLGADFGTLGKKNVFSVQPVAAECVVFVVFLAVGWPFRCASF